MFLCDENVLGSDCCWYSSLFTCVAKPISMIKWLSCPSKEGDLQMELSIFCRRKIKHAAEQMHVQVKASMYINAVIIQTFGGILLQQMLNAVL